MNINDAFPSNYLKANELKGDTVLTIKSVAVEEIGQGRDKDTKPILYFTDSPKGLALNVTNKNTLVGLYGVQTENWIGKRITLFPAEVDFQGDVVPAVRIRKTAPGGNGAASPQPTNGGNGASATGQVSAKFMACKAFVQAHGQQTMTPEMVAELKTAAHQYNPGLPTQQWTDADWKQFHADNFVPRATVPAGAEPEFDLPAW